MTESDFCLGGVCAPWVLLLVNATDYTDDDDKTWKVWPCCDAVLVSAEFDRWRHTRSAGDSLESWTGTATSRSSCRSRGRRTSPRSPRGTAGEAGRRWSRSGRPAGRRCPPCRRRRSGAWRAAAADSPSVDGRSWQTGPVPLPAQSSPSSPAQTTRLSTTSCTVQQLPVTLPWHVRVHATASSEFTYTQPLSTIFFWPIWLPPTTEEVNAIARDVCLSVC